MGLEHDINAEMTASLLLGVWDSGGRKDILVYLKGLEPAKAAAVPPRLAGWLFERNVLDHAELLEVLGD